MKFHWLLLPVSWGYDIVSNTTVVPLENWLSYFSEIKVGDLPMVPGSHDSGTMTVSPEEDWLGIAGWLYAKTQNISILAQLEAGIRFLDLRLWVVYDEFDQDNGIFISHTFRSTYTLASALAEVKSFLSAQPTEFVYIYIRIDSAHPLTEDIPERKSFIESTLLESGLLFANVVGSDLTTLKVKDVAQKVILVSDPNQVLPTDSLLLFISSPAEYTLCDIYEYTSQYLAQEKISSCFPATPSSTVLTGQVTGFALDGQFDQVWPNITSPQMNDWFLYNFQSNSIWENRKLYPIGVFLFDFVDSNRTAIYLEFIMNFGYPYPYVWHKEAWEPGMNITTKSASPNIVFYLAIILSLITCIG